MSSGADLGRTGGQEDLRDIFAPVKNSNSGILLGFLKKGREKKERNSGNNKKKDGGNGSGKEDSLNSNDTASNNSSGDGVRIDEEGYIIREPSTYPSQHNDMSGFYSSDSDDCDSDRENEDDVEMRRRIKFEIKPVNNQNKEKKEAVEDLRRTIQSISISPLLRSNRGRGGTVKSNKFSKYKSEGVLNNGLQCNGGMEDGSADSWSSSSSKWRSIFAEPPSTLRPRGNVSNSLTPKDRYAELSDLFTMDISNDPTNANNNSTTTTSLLSKSTSSHSVHSPWGQPGTTNLSRAQTHGSLLCLGPSSVPSPLTVGISEMIPVAAAIQESISTCFRGADENKTKCSIFGCLQIAFPAGIIQVFARNQPQLSFQLTNTKRLRKVIVTKQLLTQYQDTEDVKSFTVNLEGLQSQLKVLFKQNPAARYYNVEMLKYQVESSPTVDSCPLQVVTHWKCDSGSTGLKIIYKYNSHALSTSRPLKDISFSVIVDGQVEDHQAKPELKWNKDKKEAVWRINELSRKTDKQGFGSLRGRFKVSNGPSNPSPVIVNFNCSNATFSGINFDLISPGYRLSMIKKHVLSGRYQSEADSAISYASI